MQSSVEYFHGDELAANVWMNKYALRDEDRIFELNPDMMHHRLASEYARIEQKYPNPLPEADIYRLLKDFRYIVPQGSPMSGIGNSFQVVSLSNCFVIGNAGNSDSYGGIMKIDRYCPLHAALFQHHPRGGAGRPSWCFDALDKHQAS